MYASLGAGVGAKVLGVQGGVPSSPSGARECRALGVMGVLSALVVFGVLAAARGWRASGGSGLACVHSNIGRAGRAC